MQLTDSMYYKQTGSTWVVETNANHGRGCRTQVTDANHGRESRTRITDAIHGRGSRTRFTDASHGRESGAREAIELIYASVRVNGRT